MGWLRPSLAGNWPAKSYAEHDVAHDRGLRVLRPSRRNNRRRTFLGETGVSTGFTGFWKRMPDARWHDDDHTCAEIELCHNGDSTEPHRRLGR